MTERERERIFNAGFNQAVKATTPVEVLKHVNFRHPQYLNDRRRAYDQWAATQPSLPDHGDVS